MSELSITIGRNIKSQPMKIGSSASSEVNVVGAMKITGTIYTRNLSEGSNIVLPQKSAPIRGGIDTLESQRRAQLFGDRIRQTTLRFEDEPIRQLQVFYY